MPLVRVTSRPTTTPFAYLARFVAELSGSAIMVLLPSIRSTHGLSYMTVSLLGAAQDYAEALTEPLSGLAIDRWRKRRLLGLSAIGVGIAVVAIPLADGLGALALGFALYGAASGPLRQVGEVILIQSDRRTASRTLASVTALSTSGALLGPLLVAAAAQLGADWQTLLVLLGLVTIAYGSMALASQEPLTGFARETQTPHRSVLQDLRAVLRERHSVAWLITLRAFYVFETPAPFEALWLTDGAGFSPSLIGVYVAFEMLIAICGNIALHRYLTRIPGDRIILVCSLVLAALIPCWLLIPGIWSRFALGGVIAFAWSMIWPIARAESLAGTERPGAVTALNSLSGLYLPLNLAFGGLAGWIGLTEAMLAWRVTGALLMALIAGVWLKGVRTSALRY